MKPVLTPTTMLFTIVRAVPHIQRALIDSSAGVTVTSLPFRAHLTVLGKVKANSPFGPFTETAVSAILTSTFSGTTIGFLPILDIAHSSILTITELTKRYRLPLHPLSAF